jgi:GNAT superfamily N-acetyltransferase
MFEFRTVTDATATEQLLEMMRGLYAEDASDINSPGETQFRHTIKVLLEKPDRGQIVLFNEHQTIQGYALLIPYWSNEFGGTLLFVDELFVKPQARSRGIGRRFFEFLSTERPFDALVCALEVSPKNQRARKLYTTLGFEPRSYTMMLRRIS